MRNSLSLTLIIYVGIVYGPFESLKGASGLFRDGIGGAALSKAGAVVASPATPIESISANPAGLALAESPSAELSISAGVGTGRFEDGGGNTGKLAERVGALGDLGVVYPVSGKGIVMGVASYFQSALRAEWNLFDPPGGLDGQTSLGNFSQRSEIILHRTAFGLAGNISPRLSVGASVGLVYNENRLRTPYIFQSHPQLQGIKTALDLDTEGLGFDGNLGLVYQLRDDLTLGFSYALPISIKAHGAANGDVGAQFRSLGGAFAAADPLFSYDARVNNQMPQIVSWGVTWDPAPRWQVSGQMDWFEWSNGFDALEVRLRNGTNGAINNFVGGSAADDVVPLNWQNRFVYRLGVEHTVSEALKLRAGYSYGRSPVPSHSLNPLVAVVSEHTVGVGLGFALGKTWVDVGYRAQIPSRRSVGTSRWLAGELDGSRVSTGVHWVSASVRFGW